MCAPCKVIINQGFRQAYELADEARGLIEANGYNRTIDDEEASAWDDPTAADEALYELALAEVEAIEKVRSSAKSALLDHLSASTEREKDPRSAEWAKKWAELVERYLG